MPELLIVDDNPASRYTTGRWLRSAGYETREASTGTEALEMVSRTTAAVVLDIHLPDIDGFQLCRTLRSTKGTSTIPVIHLSAAHVTNADRVRGLDGGADAYLTHPVDPEILAATVRTLIRAREAEEALLRNQLQLHAMTEAALQAERAKVDLMERFVGVLAHDLRNPLAAIQTAAELLLLSDGGSRLGTRIKASSQRMAALIADVLDVTRGRLGSGIGARMEVCNELAASLRDVVDEARHATPGREVLETIAIERPIVCDRRRLQQLVSNLLGNALTHGVPDRPVVVTAGVDDAALTIAVTNQGTPIAPTDMERIFEPFWQAVPQRQREGLGLGLHICAQIVEAHGGKLEVASSAADGTCFTAVIPLDRATVP